MVKLLSFCLRGERDLKMDSRTILRSRESGLANENDKPTGMVCTTPLAKDVLPSRSTKNVPMFWNAPIRRAIDVGILLEFPHMRICESVRRKEHVLSYANAQN
jgi:hypothetical protein